MSIIKKAITYSYYCPIMSDEVHFIGCYNWYIINLYFIKFIVKSFNYKKNITNIYDIRYVISICLTEQQVKAYANISTIMLNAFTERRKRDRIEREIEWSDMINGNK